MTNLFIEEKADIYKLPQVDGYKSNKNSQITIGDLHGNAMKLLYVLVRHGIATNINNEEYDTLVEIYKTIPTKLTKNHINEFNRILDKMNFNRESTIRLIGDELADRGMNDYFTLKILEKLDEKKVKTDIVISNHSEIFIKNFEKKISFGKSPLLKDQAFSMQAMQVLIKRGIIDKNEILGIVEKTYKKLLNAISYTLSKDKKEISIYSHAPIGLNNIKKIAESLKINYDGSTAVKLAQTIDEINKKFHSYVMENKVNELCKARTSDSLLWSLLFGSSNTPFWTLIWNREYKGLERPQEHNNYKLNFVHGHDSRGKTENNIYNLDNNLGKTRYLNKGTYSFTYFDNSTQLQKIKEVSLYESYNSQDIEILPNANTRFGFFSNEEQMFKMPDNVDDLGSCWDFSPLNIDL